jgi:hypothetical protein
MCLFVEVKEFILFERDSLYTIYISETALLINITIILDIAYHLEFLKYVSESRYVSIIRYKGRKVPSHEPMRKSYVSHWTKPKTRPS